MAKTIVGLFDTRATADQAVQALVNQGIATNDISVVANNAAGSPETTTGSGDSAATGAATGAIGGGVLGGTLGLLVGIGALAIPGIGPILAAGPIAAALGAAGTTALVGAGIGAVGGGLLGALVGAGIPEEDANHYAEGVRRGGTLVMANVDDANTGMAYNVMQQFGAVDMDNHEGELRQSGWERFDPEGGEWQRSSKVGTAGGTVAGAATGAAVGSVGGPVGTVIGGIAGAVTGAATGAAGDAVGKEATESTGGATPRDASYSSKVSHSAPVVSNVTTTHTSEVSHAEPVMSNAADQPRGRGARIYGEGKRYNLDDTANSAMLLGAANTSGVAGSSGTMGNTALGGAAVVAAADTMRGDRTSSTMNRSGVDNVDSPTEEWQESSKVGTATGTAAGAATGAAIGSVGGPIGTVVGGIAGAATGAVTGAAGDAAGEATEDSIDGEGVADAETTNDVGGRKGQVKPRE